jgi:hypothetical protein
MCRPLVVLPVVLAVVLSQGCSGGPRSDVFGTITYEGKPVKGGTIILLAPDNRTYPGRIQDDGSYRITSVPQGKIQVAVQGSPPRVKPRPAPDTKGPTSQAKEERKTADNQKQAALPPPPSDGLQIPAWYSDPTRSGLSLELGASQQEFSVDLKRTKD